MSFARRKEKKLLVWEGRFKTHFVDLDLLTSEEGAELIALLKHAGVREFLDSHLPGDVMEYFGKDRGCIIGIEPDGTVLATALALYLKGTVELKAKEGATGEEVRKELAELRKRSRPARIRIK